MSGDRSPIRLTAERDTVLERAVQALGQFPSGQPWVLIGGLAVFIRVGSITRPTADADTVARSQADLLRKLVERDTATVISGGDVQMTVGDGTVDIDIMDLADDHLPTDIERRAFALARRCALSVAVTERIVVSDHGGNPVTDAAIARRLDQTALQLRVRGSQLEAVATSASMAVRCRTEAAFRQRERRPASHQCRMWVSRRNPACAPRSSARGAGAGRVGRHVA